MPQPQRSSSLSLRRTLLLLSSAALLVTAGCGMGVMSSGNETTSVTLALQGSVHGGQQPVNGATIQLYAAGKNGYGSASRAMITTTTVKSNAGGMFSVTGTYTCQAGDLVYLVATGGNPGVSGTQNNSALAEMAGLGPCGALSAATFINVNELTTIASVWALAPFMNGIANVGSTPTNTLGLINAFASINSVVSIANGNLPGAGLPAGATLPVNEINSLADIIANCVNTVDTTSPAAQSSTCMSLFTAATTSTSTPTNTIQAALNLAHNPTLGLALNSAVTATAPFQPTLNAAPGSWTIAINYTGGGLKQPSAIATDASGNIWVTNPGNNSVTKLAAASGAALSPAAGFTAGPLSTPTGVSVDTAGNAWIANKGSNTLTKLVPAGTSATNYTGGGLNQPNTVAIDAAGNVWLGNAGNDTLSEFNSAGTAISPAGGFSLGVNTPSAPTAIAINPK